MHTIEQAVFKLDVFDLLELDFYIFDICHGWVFGKDELDCAGDRNDVILNFSVFGQWFAEAWFDTDIGILLSDFAKFKFFLEFGFVLRLTCNQQINLLKQNFKWEVDNQFNELVGRLEAGGMLSHLCDALGLWFVLVKVLGKVGGR